MRINTTTKPQSPGQAPLLRRSSDNPMFGILTLILLTSQLGVVGGRFDDVTETVQ